MNFRIIFMLSLLLASFAVAAEKIDIYTEEIAQFNDEVEVALIVDMSDASEKLGSYTASVEFNADSYEYVSFKAADDFSTVVNAQEAEAGKLVFAAANPYGAHAKVQVLSLKFKSEKSYAPQLKVDVSAMAAAESFNDLTDLLDAQATSIDIEEMSIPQEFSLGNYPNPFNPSTKINFDLPKASEISIEIFNVVGEKVTSLAQARYDAGSHSVSWNATDGLGKKVPAGTYIVRMKAGDTVKNHRMLLIK